MSSLWVLLHRLRQAASGLPELADSWLRLSIRIQPVAERPRSPKRRRLYVTFQAGAPAFGVMICPCGCGETLNLRFFGERNPRWSVTWDGRKRPTVLPSIWRKSGCHSHFHLIAGRVRWC